MLFYSIILSSSSGSLNFSHLRIILSISFIIFMQSREEGFGDVNPPFWCSDCSKSCFQIGVLIYYTSSLRASLVYKFTDRSFIFEVLCLFSSFKFGEDISSFNLIFCGSAISSSSDTLVSSFRFHCILGDYGEFGPIDKLLLGELRLELIKLRHIA